MAIRTQNWHPDTCDCIIEQTHDPDNPAYGVQFSKVIQKCISHQNIADDQINNIVYANVDSEQKRKNGLYRKLLEDDALALFEIVKNPDGTSVRQLKSGIGYNWSFQGLDDKRVLSISITGVALSVPVKNAIKAYCDTTFGVGKVVIL